MDKTVYSIQQVPIRISEERWQHIVERHPEMQSLRSEVEQTVQEPDTVQQGDYGELLAIRFYPTTPLTSKYLVVVYKELSKEDGYIITAYLTRRPSQRRQIIWQRQT